MASWKESMINRLSNLKNCNRSAAKISQVLCSNANACNDLIWASLQLLSSTAKDPGHLSKCATSFPPCLLHPQHYFNILCSIALLSLSFAIYNYWEYLIE